MGIYRDGCLGLSSRMIIIVVFMPTQAYVNNLNIAEGQYHDAVEKNDISTAIALQGGIKFNGGGHINHSIFWTNLAPTKLGGGSLQPGIVCGSWYGVCICRLVVPISIDRGVLALFLCFMVYHVIY